ncbi:MAG: NfeD family protein [Gemmatimonadetes bacterium]|nr:NfeD family protein [Gemmatimonadota bacterium]
MTSLFLGCFAFGLIFTVASFLFGAFGSGSDLHIPGLDSLLGHGGDAGGGAASGGHGGPHMSPFSFSTASAFLTWFGGAGYLLMRYSNFAAATVLVLSGTAGLIGGGLIFLTLTKFVLPRLTEMRAEDYRIEGTVARVSSGIRAGGIGEIVYSLAGTRRVDGARSETGEAIEQGTEVVVLRMERGVAYVERWERFAEKHELPPDQSGTA